MSSTGAVERRSTIASLIAVPGVADDAQDRGDQGRARQHRPGDDQRVHRAVRVHVWRPAAAANAIAPVATHTEMVNRERES